MTCFWGFGKTLASVFLLFIVNSCALVQAGEPRETYYTIPSVTYIREFPGYASPYVATIYRGEQVKVLSGLANDWRRVQTVKRGQIGWIQRPLLSPVPIPTGTYMVRENEAPLQDTPQKEGFSRQVLRRGDKVKKLSENDQGWWQVLVEKDESLGWLPGTALTAAPAAEPAASQAAAPSGDHSARPSAPSAPGPQQYMYVAVHKLDLHDLPLLISRVIKSLKFQDKVEKVAQAPGSNWLKVRYPETGAQGWAQAAALSESLPQAPKVFPPKKQKPLKKPRRHQPPTPETVQPEEVEPEVM